MSAHNNIFQTSDFIILILAIISRFLEWLIPSDFGIDRYYSMVVGVFMLLVSWTVIFIAKYQFRIHGQRSGPGYATTSLIKAGLFKYSRNPIYLAVVFIIPAVGFFVNSVWMVATIVPCFLMLEKILIVPEERYLYRKFGEEWLEYCRSVGRWV